MSAPSPTLAALAGRWRRRRLAAGTLWGLALGLPAAAAIRLAAPATGAAALAGALAAPVLALALWQWRRAGREGARAVARHLDRRLPPLEESAELLLAPAGSGPTLARLQRRRVAERLAAVSEDGLLPSAPLARGAAAAAAGALLAVAIGWWGPRAASARLGEPLPPAGVTAAPATVLESVELIVTPPAYTGREPRREPSLSAAVEEGGTVAWRVRVSGPFDSARIAVEGGDGPPLVPAPDGELRAELVVERSWVYSVVVERAGAEVARSGLARLERLPDRPPRVTLRRPPRLSVVERPGPLAVEVEAVDDHGVASLDLVLTLASGAGENVSFRERRRPLRLPAPGATATTRLDLAQLGLDPGAELYLFAEARDRRPPGGQLGRSPTHIVRRPGGSGPSVGLGAGLPVLRLPASFRSQRQIILDTERLLAEAPAIGRPELERRSAAIGLDQRALRMRYGVLLGEEFVGGRPADEADSEAEPPGGESPLAAVLPEELVHQHDAAAENTFFDPALRQTLREALAAMWEAEGLLRTFRPEAALPFEYTALRRLKSAQEGERAYVRKLGFEPPPLDDERRLSGELDGVPSRRRRYRPTAEEAAEIQLLAAALSGPGEPGWPAALAEAAALLGRRAAADPGFDLTALAAARRLAGGTTADAAAAARDLEAVLGALARLAPPPLPRPGASAAEPGPVEETG